MFLPLLTVACALVTDGGAPRPRGIDAPVDAEALVSASLPILALLAQPPSPALAAILADAGDMEALVGPGLAPPTPPPQPLPALSPTRALVTGDGPLSVGVSFYDEGRGEHVSLSFVRRLAPADSKAPDVLLLALSPEVLAGPPRAKGNEFAMWLAATKAGKGAPRFRPVPPTAEEKANLLGGFGKPFSPCARALQHAADSINIAAVLKTDEEFRYLPELEQLSAEVREGVTFSVKVSKDRRAYTADIRYRDGVGRLKFGAPDVTLVKPCRRGR